MIINKSNISNQFFKEFKEEKHMKQRTQSLKLRQLYDTIPNTYLSMNLMKLFIKVCFVKLLKITFESIK